MMEVGPMGLYLTETSASAPAASVGIASAHPLPSANPVTARGLTALARPPPIMGASTGIGSSTGSEWMSKPKPDSAVPDWAVTFAQWDTVEPTLDTRGANLVRLLLVFLLTNYRMLIGYLCYCSPKRFSWRISRSLPVSASRQETLQFFYRHRTVLNIRMNTTGRFSSHRAARSNGIK